MIAILDYGAGNLRSVVSALQYIGCDVSVTRDAQELMKADGAVLPGVGAFGDAVSHLRRGGLEQPIRDFIATGRPFLGICVGLQMLFEGSEESPGVPGLGIFRGMVRRIPSDGLKVPHIGWNSLAWKTPSPLFSGLGSDPYVYFVHSYYLKAAQPEIVTAQTRYGVDIDAAVGRDNVFATQFHPEKSGETGLAILRNFTQLVKG